MIEDVFVSPGRRGSGLAAALLHAAVEVLRDQGCGPVTFAAEVGDTPADLYRRRGFRPDRVVRSYTAPPAAAPTRLGRTGRPDA